MRDPDDRPDHGLVEDEVERRVETRTADLAAANERLEMFRQFVETSGEGMGWGDLDGTARYANPALLRMVGEPDLEAVLDRPLFRYYGEEAQRRIREEVIPVALRDGSWTGELTLRAVDGRRTSTKHFTVLIRDEQGQPLRFASVMTDLTELERADEELRRHRDHLEELVEEQTAHLRGANRELQEEVEERRRVEAALRESEEWHRTIVETSKDGMVSIDRQGLVTVFNAAAERIFGWSRQEILGQPLDRLLPEVYREKHQRFVAEFFTSGEPRRAVGRTLELRAVRKDGTTVPVEISPAAGERGGQPFVLAIVRDISERRRAEEERTRLEELLQRSQRIEAVGQISGGIAHDFGNLLQAIMLAVSMAQDGLEPGSPSHADLEEALEAGRRAEEMSRQLLAFGRRQELCTIEFDLDELLGDFAVRFRKVLGERVAVEVRPAGSLPLIPADRGKLEQVLLNLCVNARDAMPGGGTLTLSSAEVRIEEGDPRLSAAPRAQAGHFVTAEVADTGTGMDEATRAKIFEPFFTSKEAGKGSGLGLPTVLGIVEQHRGFVLVESEPGQGSCFRVFLPVGPAEG